MSICWIVGKFLWLTFLHLSPLFALIEVTPLLVGIWNDSFPHQWAHICLLDLKSLTFPLRFVKDIVTDKWWSCQKFRSGPVRVLRQAALFKVHLDIYIHVRCLFSHSSLKLCAQHCWLTELLEEERGKKSVPEESHARPHHKSLMWREDYQVGNLH